MFSSYRRKVTIANLQAHIDTLRKRIKELEAEELMPPLPTKPSRPPRVVTERALVAVVQSETQVERRLPTGTYLFSMKMHNYTGPKPRLDVWRIYKRRLPKREYARHLRKYDDAMAQYREDMRAYKRATREAKKAAKAKAPKQAPYQAVQNAVQVAATTLAGGGRGTKEKT